MIITIGFAQALLALGLPLFAVLARALRPRHALRLAQSAVLLAFFLPPSLAALPQRELTALPVHRLFTDGEHSSSRTGMMAAHPSTPPPNSTYAYKTRDLSRAVRELSVPRWVALLWAFGALLCAARTALSLLSLRRLLRSSSVLRSLGRARIVVSARASVPFSFRGLTTCWVVIPESLVPDASGLRIAVLHELQHHRQGDTLWAVLEELVFCFCFPNPAFALWRRRIAEAQEFSCDEALLGRKGVSPREYGSCLVRVAETALGGTRRYAGTALMSVPSRNPAYQQSFLRRRIEMIMERKNNKPRKAAAFAAGTLLAAGLVTAAVAAEGVRRDDGPNPGFAQTDQRVQEIADRILADAVKEQRAKAGFAIVADPQAGRVLAVANVDTRAAHAGHWALAQRFEPASVAKTFVAAEAIEEGKTTAETEHFCENGSFRYHGKTYHDWRDQGFGWLTTARSIEKSSDICATKIADLVGAEGLLAMLTRFGMGPGGTASSFPESRPGVLPAGATPALVPSVAYGQGFQATPLEIVQAYGAIANGGELLAPLQANEPGRKVLRRVLSRESADSVKRILERVVLRGTARGAESALYSTAGKTATGFTQEIDGPFWGEKAPLPNLAAFVGFAPVASPRVEVYVGILDPHTDESGAHGAAHAVPVFKKIAEAVLQEWGVAPDKR